MSKKPLESLGALVHERRGAKKLRETAAEIGIVAATLLRVEGGRIPDVMTYGKLCRWLGIDPGVLLGCEASSKHGASVGDPVLLVSAHLRINQARPETIKAVAEMILLAANAQGEDEGH